MFIAVACGDVDLMPSVAVMPDVVTPELAAAALILVNPSNARGIGFRLVEADPSLDMDTAVLTAWLRAIAAPLLLPDYECAQWLAAVTVLAAAGDEGFTAARVRDAVSAAGEEKDAGARTDEWLEDWAWFGAVTAVTVLSESAHPDAARLTGIVQEAKVQDQ
jgi:hypothetical protein